MSAYIDKTYLETFFSAAQIDKLLEYGENDSSAKQAKVDLLISGSSDMIDSFLYPAGYNLPLETVPNSIKKACCYLVINDLYSSANQPIPETFSDQVSQQYAFLNLLRDKKLSLNGLDQDTDIGTGASTFDFNVTSGDPARIFDKKKLRGNYY